MLPRRWYRSLYWRIAAGFIAFLAVMLLAQVGLFVWLSSDRDDALPPRLLANLAALVADELGAEASRAPGADLSALARERFDDLGRPAVLLLPDGRVVASTATLPARGAAAWHAAPAGAAGRRPRLGAATPARHVRSPGTGPCVRLRRAGCRRARAAHGHAAVGGGAGTRRRSRGRCGARGPRAGGWSGRPRAGAVAGGRAGGAARRGTALASLAVFRPAHARLRNLEDAARRFGEGDRTARASARGGDEVSAVARAFNRMADEAAAREAALRRGRPRPPSAPGRRLT